MDRCDLRCVSPPPWWPGAEPSDRDLPRRCSVQPRTEAGERRVRSRVMRQALAAMALLCAAVLLRPAAAQAHDVSASYDHDGTLILDSRNFRGMTQQGIWVVMFYSYSVVIKSMDEAMICQRFTWLWGDLANRYSNMGGETRGGDAPSIHVAKYDASDERERRFVSTLIGMERVEALPAIFIFEGDSVRKLPDWQMEKMIEGLADIDRLEGYDDGMECDPPADYYQAYTRNQANLARLSYFITGYLADTRRKALQVPREASAQELEEATALEEREEAAVAPPLYDPTDAILDAAREAVREEEEDGMVLERRLAHMLAVYDSDINSPCPLSFQTALHIAAAGGETETVKVLLQHGADLHLPDGDGEVALHKAAEGGRRGVVRVLVAHGAKLDSPRLDDGATPLHLAAYTGHGDVCKLLAALGADVEARTLKGQSALHFAAMSGYVHELNAAEALVAVGADLDAQDNVGWTPAMHAVRMYQAPMLLKLIELGADLNVGDDGGSTALHHAMFYGHEHHVYLLLKHGADPYAKNSFGLRAIDKMSRSGNHDEDKVSKKTGEPRTTMQWQKDMRFLTWPYQLWWLAPLWPALGGHWMRPDWQHKLKLIQPLTRLRRAAAALHRYLHRHWYSFFGPLLLAHSDMTPYHRFTQKRLLDVEEFHDKQTLGGDHEGDVWLYDMNEKEFEMLKQWSELQRAVYFGQTWLVEQLLRDGKASFVEAADSINADSGSIVIPSGGGEDKGMVRYQGNCVDIQAKDHLGCSPLHLAVKAGHLDMVEVLLKYGARTDAADDLGWTPLMLAAHTGFIDALEAMLRTDDAAPDVGNALDKQQTALMLAAAEGHLNAVKVLAVAGSDLDATDSDGRTALNYAVSHAHHHVMQWLKNRGATLRVGRELVGFDATTSWQEVTGGGYSPIDEPDEDVRNPRYSGPQ